MSASSFLRQILLFLFLVRFSVADQKCYGLNGTQLSDEYGPCNTGAEHSGCCAINRPAGSADMCLSSGLCMATIDGYMGTIWNSGCTDPTGMDPSCPKLCPDARNNFNNGPKVSAWNLQVCDYGTYCCRAVNDRRSCCNNATSPKIQPKSIGALVVDVSVTSSAATSAPTASTTQSPLPLDAMSSTTSTSAALCTSEKRQTEIVGGTLSGIFGAIVLCLLAAVFFFYQKEKRQRKLKEHYEEQFATNKWGVYAKVAGSKSTVAMLDVEREGVDKDTEVFGPQKSRNI